MKTASKLVLGLSMALMVGLLARAEDKKDADGKSGKEVTLTGTVTCAKCDLKLQKSCNTVVKVTKDGKDTIYYFDKDSNKKYHKDTCTEAKDGTVTGTVTTKDDKKWITVTKLEYK